MTSLDRKIQRVNTAIKKIRKNFFDLLQILHTAGNYNSHRSLAPKRGDETSAFPLNGATRLKLGLLLPLCRKGSFSVCFSHQAVT